MAKSPTNPPPPSSSPLLSFLFLLLKSQQNPLSNFFSPHPQTNSLLFIFFQISTNPFFLFLTNPQTLSSSSQQKPSLKPSFKPNPRDPILKPLSNPCHVRPSFNVSQIFSKQHILPRTIQLPIVKRGMFPVRRQLLDLDYSPALSSVPYHGWLQGSFSQTGLPCMVFSTEGYQYLSWTLHTCC